MLASLNHPNIAHIHGLAETDGARAFVMELVEGPTLADRVVRGPIPLLLETAQALPQDWSRDGRFLLYSVVDPKTGRDLWALDMTNKQRPTRAVVNTPFDERNGQFSPDGHWLAYETNESGRFEIVAVSFPDPTERWPVSRSGGTQARWRADGKDLYFVAPDGQLMAAPVTIAPRAGGSTFEAGAPVSLFKHKYCPPP